MRTLNVCQSITVNGTTISSKCQLGDFYILIVHVWVKIHVLYLLHNIDTLLQTNKLCEITKDNQKEQNLVNYNKCHIGVNVIIGNLVQKSEITTSEWKSTTVTPGNTVTLCPTELLLCAPRAQTLQRQRLPPLLPIKVFWMIARSEAK